MRKQYRSLSPLLPWRDMKRPIAWAEVFGREAPLEVEIGFGKGEYLTRLAQASPGRDFVGIEVEWGSVRRALAALAREKIDNVRLILADTRVAFDRIFSPQSIERVYALFPMPWPKERHVRHRVFSQGFLKVLNSRLKERGVVQIVTDYEPYFLWILDQVPETGLTVTSRIIPPSFATKYELKWREKGQEDFFHLSLTKRDHLAIPPKEDIPLKTYRVPEFDPEHFVPRPERGEVVVEFKDFIYDAKRRKGMVRVFSAEDKLTQNFWIEIVYGEGNWQIRVAQGCGILPTVGVQTALDLVWEACGGKAT